MSRSRRHTPIFGITTATTEKAYKAAEHRRERAAVRSALDADQEPPQPRAFGNPWKGDKDGKRWWRGADDEAMRK